MTKSGLRFVRFMVLVTIVRSHKFHEKPMYYCAFKVLKTAHFYQICIFSFRKAQFWVCLFWSVKYTFWKDFRSSNKWFWKVDTPSYQMEHLRSSPPNYPFLLLCLPDCMVHMYKMIISPEWIFFISSKFWFFGLLRG